MSSPGLTKRKVSTRPNEWVVAWKEFNAACKKLGVLADRDGDLLKIDVKYKPGAAVQKK